MSGFPPKPGTAAYRVLAHLETILPRRPRATAGMVAGELRGLTPSQVRDALEAAHDAGYVNREHEVGLTGRGPVFYELVRRTTGELVVGGGSPDRDTRPFGAPGAEAAAEDGPWLTSAGDPAHEPRGVIEPVVNPNPETVAAESPQPPAPVLPRHDPAAALSKVVAIHSRADGGFTADLERTPQLSDWLRATRGLPVAERDEPETVVPPAGGVVVNHNLGFEPGPTVQQLAAPAPAAEPVIPSGVQLDFAPGPDQFAVALASDGRLFCWRGTVPFVWSKEEARVLVQHLNRMDLDVLLEPEAGE